MPSLKLGKKAAAHDPRTLRLAKYLPRTLPPAPEVCDWSNRVPSFPMYDNDRIGCCAIATVAHQTQAWSFSDNDSTPTTPALAQVVKGYQDVGGYIPGRPETDGGCVMLDVLNRWRKEGLCGSRISAFAAIDFRNHEHVKQAIYLCGGLMLGVLLPRAIENRAQWLAPTDPRYRVGDWQSGSWGGHAVTVVKYDAQWLYCVSWGRLIPISWNFWDAYVDEAFIAISALFFGKDFRAPNGFDINKIVADAGALAK